MEGRYVTRIALVVFITGAVIPGFRAVPQAFANSGPCADDMANYCKDVRPGQGRIITCLEGHENNLSSGCRAKLAEMEKKRPCTDDAIRYCSEVQRGEGRVLQCLAEHENELTPQCKANIETQHRNKRRE